MSQLKEAQNTYRLPDTVKGTTLKAENFEVLINDVAPTPDLSSVTCVLAKDGVATLTPTITITSAANWQFTVGPVAAASMGLEEGLHVGDIKTTDATGIVQKYCRLELQILPSPQ